MGADHDPPPRGALQRGAGTPSLPLAAAVPLGQPGFDMATSAAGPVLIVGR